jgi:translocator protein
MRLDRPLLLLGFLVLVLGGGFAIGTFTRPDDEWYNALAKPSFTPPGWLFPVAWTVLYTFVAIAGYRTFIGQRGRVMNLWWVQLALNFLWPIVFFAAHQIGLAFVVIGLLLTAILAFLSMTHDVWAKFLFAPYAAWVAFAAVLNGSIFAAN